jgi:hypothetical protein
MVDPIQQTVAEELKDALRRQTIDREAAKIAIRFLGQSMGRSLHLKLRQAHEAWLESRDDAALIEVVVSLAEEFAKERPSSGTPGTVRREQLELVCFEYVSG